MAEPQIRYVKTSDGVDIAYTVTGEGPPVTFVSALFGGLHMRTHMVRDGLAAEGLIASGTWRVIDYDQRGTGSSDRSCEDFSLEPLLRDLEAVMERATAGEPCALVATTSAGPVAIAYAARNPARVSRLVLRNAVARGSERGDAMLGMVVSLALRPVLEKNPELWEFFTLTLANALTGYADSDSARQRADGYRTAISPQSYLAASRALDDIDTSDLLHAVLAPTLVVNDTQYISVGAGWGPVARQLASRIPNARLVTTDDFPSALEQFLREGGAPVSEKGSAGSASGTAVILFTDIADSTALTERMGDAAFRDASRALDAGLRTAIREAGGEAVEGKLLGDGVLATFGAAAQAIDGARRCLALSAASELGLHIGLHAGDVIREEGNVFGGAVNIASRICGLSAAGEILVSDVVRGMARSSAGVAFEDRGEQAMKGVGEPVRVYAVRWRDQ